MPRPQATRLPEARLRPASPMRGKAWAHKAPFGPGRQAQSPKPPAKCRQPRPPSRTARTILWRISLGPLGSHRACPPSRSTPASRAGPSAACGLPRGMWHANLREHWPMSAGHRGQTGGRSRCAWRVFDRPEPSDPVLPVGEAHACDRAAGSTIKTSRFRGIPPPVGPCMEWHAHSRGGWHCSALENTPLRFAGSTGLSLRPLTRGMFET